jgi:hypothetical protein
MSLAWCLYLVDVIASFDCITSLFCVGLCMGFAFLLIGWFITLQDGLEDCNKVLSNTFARLYRKSWLIALIFILNVAVPTKQTMYLMIGSAFLSQSNIPTKVSQALELKLDDVIKELSKKDDKK